MVAAVCVAVLGASIASPSWTCVDLDDRRCAFFTEYFAEQLAQGGDVRVTTSGQMGALLGMERQKQLLSCDSGAGNCLAELAGALGADGIVTGNVAKMSSGFAATVRAVRANGSPIAGFTGRVASDAELLDFLSRSAAELRAKLLGSDAREVEATAGGAGPASVRSRAWVPAAAGGVLAIAGAVSVVVASSYAQRLERGDPTLGPDDVGRVASTGEALRTAGAALLITGSAALVVAGAMALFGGPATPVAVITPDGAAVSLTVRWP